MIKLTKLDRHGLRPRDDVIASDSTISRERGAAGGNPDFYFKQKIKAVRETHL